MIQGTRNDLDAEGYKFMFYIGKKHNTALYKKNEFRFVMRQNKEGWFQYLPQYVEGRNAGLYLTERMRKQDEGKIMGLDRLPSMKSNHGLSYMKMTDKEQKFAMHEAQEKIAHSTIDYLMEDDDSVVEHWQEPRNVIENKIRMHNYEMEKPKNILESNEQSSELKSKVLIKDSAYSSPKNMTEVLKQINHESKVEIYDNGSVYLRDEKK